MIPPSGNASVSIRSGGRLKPRPPPRPPPRPCPPAGGAPCAAPAAGAPGDPCAAAPMLSAATIANITTELTTVVRIRNLSRRVQEVRGVLWVQEVRGAT